jgi:hypothetical protein
VSPELLEQVGGVPGRGLFREAVEASEEDELVGDAFLVVQAALLRHVADGAADVVVDADAVDPRFAGIGGEDAEGDAHGRGFPCAVGADEAVDLAGGDGEGHVGQCVDDRVAGAVGLRQVVEFEGGHGVLLRGPVDGFPVASLCLRCGVSVPDYRRVPVGRVGVTVSRPRPVRT